MKSFKGLNYPNDILINLVTNVVLITWENGTGKTTLLNVLSGIEKPSDGQVLINGFNLHTEKDKLEGVIGHEMSHVANYDIRFVTVVAVVVPLGAVVLLAVIVTALAPGVQIALVKSWL